MDIFPKRTIIPMFNWEEYLSEGKEEFVKLFEFNCSQIYKKDDFQFIKILGKGGFGCVSLVKMLRNGKYYAIKVLEKVTIVKRRQVFHAINEKRILQALNCPFCTYLNYGFQDNSYIYFCLPFISGGDLFTHLRKVNRFEEPVTNFYGAQVLLALEYLHYCDLIFRDLKPENVLIDQKGYLKLTDFGFCKIVNGRAYTMCGTPEYIAPEIIFHTGYGQTVDWWAYGVLLYEMSVGYTPFQAYDQMEIFLKVTSGQYVIPRFLSSELANLIQNILQVDLSRRYGNLKNGINDIKGHGWYKDMNWEALFNGKLVAPFIPTVEGEGDTRNFDSFAELEMKISSQDRFSKYFENF